MGGFPESKGLEVEFENSVGYRRVAVFILRSRTDDESQAFLLFNCCDRATGRRQELKAPAPAGKSMLHTRLGRD